MIKEYKTIFADGAASFTSELNKYAKRGFELEKFEYREYTQRIKEEGSVVVQAYVGVMCKQDDSEQALRDYAKDNQTE